MSDPLAPNPYGAFKEELVAAGILWPSDVAGVVGRSGGFERVVEGFERLIDALAAPLADDVVRFPPVMSRAAYERVDHIHNFPDLMGSVHTFIGKEAEHRALVASFEAGEDWSRGLAKSEVMLIPAACYPLYPALRGTLPEGGRTVDLRSWVFRHEPSEDPARMQCFRQREVVCLGSAEEAAAHRDAWLARGAELLGSLGLAVEKVVANDPFFGRGGRLAKATQREQALKYELVAPICSEEKPTALSSANCHLDHFGGAFGIRTADGSPAHTACIGFGLERITLALYKAHGLDTAAWPERVRTRLGLA